MTDPKLYRPEQPAAIQRKDARARGVFEEAVKLEILTPVFGGGVWIDPNAPHKKQHDEVTPIRSAAIRGHLRFWWRATHGAQHGSIAAMRAAEDAIWGNASIAGEIRLSVEQRITPSDYDVYTFNVSKNKIDFPSGAAADIAYGAFPLQPAQAAQDKHPGVLHSFNGAATLKIVGPARLREQVMDALDAWLAFGGVGGRTRRGFGAVASPDRAVDPQVILKKWQAGKPLEGCPSLAGARLQLAGSFSKPIDALQRGLGALRTFRQGVQVGRNPGSAHNRPGRSRWPEPDEIRRITGDHEAQHRPAHPVRKFPRAAFGMPIIFHFKDRNDPKDTSLNPVGKERRASPLILRPSPKGQAFQALALVLNDPEARGEALELRMGRTADPSPNGLLTPPEAAQIKPLHGETDPLQAFLEFFHQQLR